MTPLKGGDPATPSGTALVEDIAEKMEWIEQ